MVGNVRPATLKESAPAAIQGSDLPNVLIIVTDDQRGGLSMMPETSKRFLQQGVMYSPAFATTPVCCPARASIMTGRYAHNHGVKSNSNPGERGADALDHSTTIQRYLDDAGYHTGIIGKFLNPPWEFSASPPHFDEWATVDGKDAPPRGADPWTDYSFNVNGTTTSTNGYITTVIRKRAVGFISRNAGETPWYLYVGTKAPHPPHPPEQRHADLPVNRWKGNPAVSERDKSDKPLYVRNAKRGIRYGNRIRKEQFRTLVSIDNMVKAIFNELSVSGEEDTLVFFISDNGLHWGEHGLVGKGTPYSQSVNVLMMANWPGHLSPGIKDSRWAANIDIAPTVMEAAAIPPNQVSPMDGRSLLNPTWSRDRILLESWCNAGTGPCNRWASLRTRTDQFVEYFDQGSVTFREYYDLRRDPWQLTNLKRDGVRGNAPPLGPLGEALEQAKACSGAECP
jgi:arylsulfatase A-like enzyme